MAISLRCILSGCSGLIVLIASFSAQAQTVFGTYYGPRQFALGGAGVALPDRGRSSNFNPAMPALSFPKDRVGLALHPVWRGFDEDNFRFKDWNLPLLPIVADHGPARESFLGVPAAYFPRIGYIGLDKESIASEPWPGYTIEGYTLTWSVALDFLDAHAAARDSGYAWTVGLTLKRYETMDEGTEYWPSSDYHLRGFAFDLGWAARWTRIPFLPGFQANLGFAFLNLGPDVFNEPDAYLNQTDALPEEYRIGWSLEYRPFEKVAWSKRKWSPVRLLATQEFEKEFAIRGSDGNVRPFFIAFGKDFDKTPLAYYRETYVNAGLEITLAEVFYLRGGRGRSSFWWEHATWSYGYGFSSGPLFRKVFFNYDFARVLDLGAARGSWTPRPREYGFQLGYLF